ERPQPFAPVGLGLHLAAQSADDVVVIERMSEPVDRGGRVARIAYLRVIVLRFRELPVLNVVDRDSADAHRALLAEDSYRALVVARVGEHGDAHRAKRAGAPANTDHGRILH